MKLRFKVYRLQVSGAPRRFVIDRRHSALVAAVPWKFVPRTVRARATITKGEPRIFLHKYIASLAHLDWEEIFFANNDPYDCRAGNLRPYRRDEEGARRKTFKNKAVPFKGVYLRGKDKYGASIRVHGKLKHLGYFTTAEAAAKAYKTAYQAAHPDL